MGRDGRASRDVQHPMNSGEGWILEGASSGSQHRVVGVLSGGGGGPWLQRPAVPDLADARLWSVKLHQDGIWNPRLCLGPWVWFRGDNVFKSFGSQPAHQVLSAKGSSQKEKSSLLSF